MIRVLLVEDHRDLAETVIEFLSLQGCTVDYAARGSEALSIIEQNNFDALILDVMLPGGMDGFEICRRVRHDHQLDIPILMLTARDQTQDKVEGFSRGADDYLVKPFDLPELSARVQALVRRHRGEYDAKTMQVHDLTLDPATATVKRQDKEIHLTPTGYRILKFLMRESPNVVSKDRIETELWGDGVPDSDALRSHLYNLRKAVDKPFEVELIRTVPGHGLQLRAP